VDIFVSLDLAESRELIDLLLLGKMFSKLKVGIEGTFYE
jgi:hypothetical protein